VDQEANMAKVLSALATKEKLTKREVSVLTEVSLPEAEQLMFQIATESDEEILYKHGKGLLCLREDNRAEFLEDTPWTWFGYLPDWEVAKALEITEEDATGIRQRMHILTWVNYLPRNLTGYADPPAPIIPEGEKVKKKCNPRNIPGERVKVADVTHEDSLVQYYIPQSYLTDKVVPLFGTGEEDGRSPVRYWIEQHSRSNLLPCDKVGWHTLMWVVALADREHKQAEDRWRRQPGKPFHRRPDRSSLTWKPLHP
jgi:hypothetical protein